MSLHQLDKAELGKRQEGLLFGGGTQGSCKCGSCSSTGGRPLAADNEHANNASGYTITGSNDPMCVCNNGGVYSIASTRPRI